MNQIMYIQQENNGAGNKISRTDFGSLLDLSVLDTTGLAWLLYRAGTIRQFASSYLPISASKPGQRHT